MITLHHTLESHNKSIISSHLCDMCSFWALKSKLDRLKSFNDSSSCIASNPICVEILGSLIVKLPNLTTRFAPNARSSSYDFSKGAI